MAKKVELKISAEKWQMLFAYMEHVENTKFKGCELSGMGEVELVEPGVFELVKLHFPEQFPSSVSTELGPEFGKIYTSLPEKNRKRLKFWWHSHTTFSCFWSATDEENIERWAKEQNYFISLVINEKNEHKIRFDMENPIILEEVDVNIVVDYKLKQKTINKVIKDLNTKLKKKPVKKVVYSKSIQAQIDSVRRAIDKQSGVVIDEGYWDKQERIAKQMGKEREKEKERENPCQTCRWLIEPTLGGCIYPDCEVGVNDEQSQLVLSEKFYEEECENEKIVRGATEKDGAGSKKVEQTTPKSRTNSKSRIKRVKRQNKKKKQAN